MDTHFLVAQLQEQSQCPNLSLLLIGHGKTQLMENLLPYVYLANRVDPARITSLKFYQRVFSK